MPNCIMDGNRQWCPTSISAILSSNHTKQHQKSKYDHHRTVCHHVLRLVPLANTGCRSGLEQLVNDEILGLDDGHREEEGADDDED
mmetsp:Transcript_21321/g.46285  ORF Transcript_21321/g.46285 Transcript_21321/m.46285 type:complete len:86 (-) Transcript_21321:1412-1669(-)